MYEIPRPFGDCTGAVPDDEIVERFRNMIYEYYGEHGRSMPWRETDDPYRILVSEIMLQQTQVARVLPKYREFVERWPSIESLAEASLRDVLAAWQGLGYNRRGRALHTIAKIVVSDHDGLLPGTEEELLALPMVGTATAAAILAFAHGVPAVYLETNVRRVFLYFFFEGRTDVRDREILPLAEVTLDRGDPRHWSYALMDYGVLLKERLVNPNRNSAAHSRQSAFEGSNRQIRGRIVAYLVEHGGTALSEISNALPFESPRIASCAEDLRREGMVAERHGRYYIPDDRD